MEYLHLAEYVSEDENQPEAESTVLPLIKKLHDQYETICITRLHEYQQVLNIKFS